MHLTTSLRGRVRHTSLPKSRALLPVTETLVNAVQAVDARFGTEPTNGSIEIHIQRSMQTAMEIDAATFGPHTTRTDSSFRSPRQRRRLHR